MPLSPFTSGVLGLSHLFLEASGEIYMLLSFESSSHFWRLVKAAPFEPAEESQGACCLMDPKGGQEPEPHQEMGFTWGQEHLDQGLEDCPDTSCLCASLCADSPRLVGPWSPPASELYISQSLETDCPRFFSSQVRNTGTRCWIPLLNLCPGGWITGEQ